MVVEDLAQLGFEPAKCTQTPQRRVVFDELRDAQDAHGEIPLQAGASAASGLGRRKDRLSQDSLGVGRAFQPGHGRQLEGDSARRVACGYANRRLVNQEPSLRHSHWNDRHSGDIAGGTNGGSVNLAMSDFRVFILSVAVNEEEVTWVQIQRVPQALLQRSRVHLRECELDERLRSARAQGVCDGPPQRVDQ
ncbi:MAG: hypothetical protein IPM35_36955 [Myxococcales bacterium]|nr:hypothetical protein [Myxococcales bacterium]